MTSAPTLAEVMPHSRALFVTDTATPSKLGLQNAGPTWRTTGDAETKEAAKRITDVNNIVKYEELIVRRRMAGVEKGAGERDRLSERKMIQRLQL